MARPRRSGGERREAGADPLESDPLGPDPLSARCFALLEREEGATAVDADAAEEMALEEASEIARREEEIRKGKKRLRDAADEARESDSEQEEARQGGLRQIEREIERLGDAVRAPEREQSRAAWALQLALPAATEASRDPVALEPPPDPRSAAMWEATFSEVQAERRTLRQAFFGRVYPGGVDQRSAVARALMDAAGPKPALTLRSVEELSRASMRLLTRKQEDDLLRTPRDLERYCRNDAQCVLQVAHGRAARECLTEAEEDELERSGRLPEQRRPCLGCMRDDVLWFYLNFKRSGACVGDGFISGHYNLVDVPGEYDLRQTLHCPAIGLPLPVAYFDAGALEAVSDGAGGAVYRQTGYLEVRPPDF
jgi:hypothetical protein